MVLGKTLREAAMNILAFRNDDTGTVVLDMDAAVALAENYLAVHRYDAGAVCPHCEYFPDHIIDQCAVEAGRKIPCPSYSTCRRNIVVCPIRIVAITST